MIDLETLRVQHRALNERIDKLAPELVKAYQDRRALWSEMLEAGASRTSIAHEAGLTGTAVTLAVAKYREGKT